jgi:glutathione synthase/RimK-type ligase-like ATP-grasp enzyme
MKREKLFRPQIRTKNHTAEVLKVRGALPLLPARCVIRLGSVTPTNHEREINSVQGARNSSNKLIMKDLFEKNGVKQSLWYTIRNSSVYIKDLQADPHDLPYPLLAKQIYGFKGKGMIMLNNEEELNNFLKTDTKGYYLEKFYSYAKEYRIHTSIATDCFYTCRKVRRLDSQDKWFFNSTNCNWLVEDNPDFDKPSCWNSMVEHAKKALVAVGLDMGAVDIRVQSNSKQIPDFIVCEINSAPSFGNITGEKYKEEIKKIITIKGYDKKC